MKLFSCPQCSSRLYFENGMCLACGTAVLYDPMQENFVVTGQGGFTCTNALPAACNWVAEAEGGFCRACSLNKTIPDLSIQGNPERWAHTEAAKRRAIYQLLHFGLDVFPKSNPGGEIGIAFDFLADPIGAGPGGEHVLTGHDNGLITLNVAEADSPEREKRRVAMGEAYRTLLGHFRHELGHYYWDRLIRDDPRWLDRFRALFGDEREDYMQALQRHYEAGPQPGWEQNHISHYAASHAWEDWAETWAHYLHIYDTLEMTAALNMPLGRLDSALNHDLPPNEGEFADQSVAARPADLEPPADFDEFLTRWLVLCEASNQINRCMGLPDLYPFVISEPAAEKLRYVHELMAETRGRSGPH
jgi:hypothetical protein